MPTAEELAAQAAKAAADAIASAGNQPQGQQQQAAPRQQQAGAGVTEVPTITTRGGKVLPLTQQTIERMRQEERAKGERSARRNQDKEAQTLGFKDHADMVRAAQRARGKLPAIPAGKPAAAPEDDAEEGTPPARAAAAPAGTPAQPGVVSDRTARKYEQTIQQLTEDKRRSNKAAARETKRAFELQRQLDAEQAANQLRLVAVQHGVVDVDYALTLLQRQYAGKSEKELVGFDEVKFFREELRNSHPHLYATEERPAGARRQQEQQQQNAGGNSGGNPPPGSKTVVPQSGKSLRERLLSGEIKGDEYRKLMADRGLTDPINGSTYS